MSTRLPLSYVRARRAEALNALAATDGTSELRRIAWRALLSLRRAVVRGDVYDDVYDDHPRRADFPASDPRG